MPTPCHRENALCKRCSRAARDSFARRRAGRCLRAWHNHVRAGADFRGVLARLGAEGAAALVADAFDGWRERARHKAWAEGSMMRCAPAQARCHDTGVL